MHRRKTYVLTTGAANLKISANAFGALRQTPFGQWLKKDPPAGDVSFSAGPTPALNRPPCDSVQRRGIEANVGVERMGFYRGANSPSTGRSIVALPNKPRATHLPQRVLVIVESYPDRVGLGIIGMAANVLRRTHHDGPAFPEKFMLRGLRDHSRLELFARRPNENDPVAFSEITSGPAILLRVGPV